MENCSTLKKYYVYILILQLILFFSMIINNFLNNVIISIICYLSVIIGMVMLYFEWSKISKIIEYKEPYEIEEKSLNNHELILDFEVKSKQLEIENEELKNKLLELKNEKTELDISEILEILESMKEKLKKNEDNAILSTHKEKIVPFMSLISGMTKKMNEIGMSVDENITQVNELKNKFKEVERILSTISDISYQTKLLALNASIEAARAGQHGKGFGVVAGEVKILSMKTKKSVEDIYDITVEMNKNLTENTNAMKKLSGDTKEGLERIVEIGESFFELQTNYEEQTTQLQEEKNKVLKFKQEVEDDINKVHTKTLHITMVNDKK